VCAGIPMGSQDSIVYVVDDDVRICEALRELFTSLNVPVLERQRIGHRAAVRSNGTLCRVGDLRFSKPI
jgi:hypothetical protein